MKGFLVLVVLAAGGWYLYQKKIGGAPQVIGNPVYGEMRVSATIEGREIEMALFVRATDDEDCHGRGTRSWDDLLKDCPVCKVQPPKCQAELAPRYARLFDDVPIPSAYLSAKAGIAGERDGRMVVYGLNDAEGIQVCEMLKTEIAKRYKGTLTCIPPNGG